LFLMQFSVMQMTSPTAGPAAFLPSPAKEGYSVQRTLPNQG